MDEIFKQILTELKDLKEGQSRLENKMDAIKEQLDEHDAKNANRHLELQNEITSLRKDISTMEVVTASNYVDIAKLKAVK